MTEPREPKSRRLLRSTRAPRGQAMNEHKRRTRRGHRRPPGTPTVVFLDDWNWSAFLQLAPALRRAGVRTVRVTTAGLRRTRVCSWLLFDRYEIASDGLGHAQLGEILAGETIVDIQYSEALAKSVRWAAGSLSPELAERLGKRLDLVDKLAASQLFAAAGIRTPATASVCDVSP